MEGHIAHSSYEELKGISDIAQSDKINSLKFFKLL
jgi:hypothetical protein